MAESTRPQFDVQNEIDPYDGIGLVAKDAHTTDKTFQRFCSSQKLLVSVVV